MLAGGADAWIAWVRHGAPRPHAGADAQEGATVHVDFFNVWVGRFADALADRAWVNDRIGYGGRSIRCEVEGFGEFFCERSACSCVRILRERLDRPRNHMIVRVLGFHRNYPFQV